MKQFQEKTKRELKSYVYVLTYSENGQEIIFYVGKGKGDRVFEHFDEVNKIELSTLKNDSLSEKQKTILNNKCNAYIVAAGLEQSEALKIESTLISLNSVLPKSFLTNKVSGHHTFPVTRVEQIDFKYSRPIDLDKYCNENKIKILGLKTNEESYYPSMHQDFRGVLEGIWNVNEEKLEQTTYVVGIFRGTIYGIYKYVKGSVSRPALWTQERWDRWQQVHQMMGRPDNLVETDRSIESVGTKRVFELIVVAVPETQNIKIETKLTDLDKKIARDLLNHTIMDKKIKSQSGRLYFGFKGKDEDE